MFLLTITFNTLGFGFVHDGEHDEDEAEEAYQRCHLDATCTEDVGIEDTFCTAFARHQDKANDNDCHSNGEQYVVLFTKSYINIRFDYLQFTIYYLQFI